MTEELYEDQRGKAATQERSLSSVKSTLFRVLEQAGRVVRSSWAP